MRRKINLKVFMWGTTGFSLLLGIWSVLSYGNFVDDLFLPTPTKVIAALKTLFIDNNFHQDILITAVRVFIGFGFATIFAIPLGTLMGSKPKISIAFRPLLAFIRYIPVSGFIPLLILWAGIGLTQKALVIFIGVFFHLTIMIADDTSRVPSEIIDTARMLSPKKKLLIWRVVLPYSLPAILDDIRLMLGAAWSYIILAELIAATSGIGNMMIESQRFLRTDKVIAGIFTIGIIGVGFDLLFCLAARSLFPWASDIHGGAE